jgi:hypothetical protein
MRFGSSLVILIILAAAFCFFPAPSSAETGLQMAPLAGPVGTPITIASSCTYGSGNYTVCWGDSLDIIKQGLIQGCGTIDFSAPAEVPKGINKVTLKVSGKSFESPFTIVPSARINPPDGIMGATVTVTGRGFAANENDIKLLFDGGLVQTGINADQRGSWQGTFRIPQSTLGNHTISASGASTPASEAGSMALRVKPKIDINPGTGSVGSLLTVEGNGFGANETDIKITYDETIVKTAVTANSVGFWRSSFYIPPSTVGIHVINAYGPQSTGALVTGTKFTISPLIQLDMSSTIGSAIGEGDMVWVTGIGFQENETGIKVTFDGDTLATGITADTKGSWTTQIQIPQSAHGKHTIKASGSATSESIVSPVELTVSPEMQISPDSGTIGQEISIRCTGFGANKPIIISFDGTPLSAGAMSDSRGNVKAAIRPPAAKGGTHVITCSDATGILLSAIFTMASMQPPAPELASPPAGLTIDKIENTAVTFQWNRVNYPVDVTYTFELSADADFSRLLTSNSDLTGDSYTLENGEADQNGTYYWRVRATDEAMNTGGWSVPRSFRVAIPDYTLLVFGIIAGAIILALIIWRVVIVVRHGK